MADVMNGVATVAAAASCKTSESSTTGPSATSSAQSTPRGEKSSSASASALMASAAKKKYLHSLSAEVTTTTTTTATSNGHSNGSARLGSGTSASPGSTSGRSSTSSLNAVGASGSPSAARPGAATPAAKANGVASSSSSSTSPARQKRESRKVSINPAAVNTTMTASHSPRPNSSSSTLSKERLSSASTTNIKDAVAMSATLSNCAASTASHRTSLVHISAEKRARKVRFFINNDKFFKGAVIAVSAEKFRTFEKILEHLTRIMCNQVTLPNGVRYIFSVDGRIIEAVAELSHEGDYVCSSTVSFKRLDYLKLARDAAVSDANNKTQWNKMKRETYYLGGGSSTKRDAYKHSGHSKSFGTKNAAAGAAANVGPSGDSAHQFKPRIIAVLRSGMRPRRAVRVLLNHRNTQSLEIVFSDLTNLVKLDSGAVRKVFALSTGKPVIAVSDLAEAEVFVAYGSDKCCPQEDFELEFAEFKSVQSILKSPDLDSKYEKFASQCASQNGSSSVSPRTSRRKFLNSRMPVKSAGPRTKARKASSSKSRLSGSSASGSPRPSSKEEEPHVPQQNGNVAHHPHHPSPQAAYPANVATKYVIGDIIGDGNFAVVRRCFGKKTKVEYALKVIDKSKCKNKEHMIESEVHILGSVSHPNIIELVEVFDLPEEKYLVTEYIRGGDLFDAIAADTKYSEDISRGMVRDLVSALKYLHDKMIVHRDIKPENLLVVNLDRDRLGGPDVSKSLKLGDFGLAQVVSEPLFTVCGTPTYVAPEILAETGYGVKVDVWATGVIMYILLVGFPPFSSRTNNQEELFDQILSGLFEFNSPDWDDISYPAKELISWMLQVDPLQRYSAYEILQHPWVKGGRQEIEP